MKARESGMPNRETSETFFDPTHIIAPLGITARTVNVAGFGCGHGTFTSPATRAVTETVYLKK